MSNKISILVLDIDGTIAKTANLDTPIRRTPHEILQYSPAEYSKSPFLFREELKLELSHAIQCGIKVVLITRAPQAYASTLIQLLGIDFTECFPSSPEFGSPESKILHIQKQYGVPLDEILYLGDTSADQVSASIAGCRFEYPYWLGTEDSASLPLQKKSLYEQLITEIFDEEGIESAYDDYINKRLDSREELIKEIEVRNIYLDVKTLLLVKKSDEQPSCLQVFNNPMASLISFKPVVCPEFISRYEYESDENCKEELFDLIKCIFRITKLVPGDYNSHRERFAGNEIRTFTEYMGTLLGESIWNKCKNWLGKSRGSGPEVNLHLLELPALVMSAFLTNDAILIPVPSSAYSPEKPGEISRRLAHRICELRNLNYLDILIEKEKRHFEIKSVKFIPNGDYCLIDDQLTDGTTVEACLDALPLQLSSKMSIMVWSFSATGQRWVVKEIEE